MSGLKPEETSNSTYRFRVQADAGKTTEFKVQERHPTEAGFALTNLTNDQVVLMMKQKRVTPAMQEAFNRILTQKNEITDLDRAMATRQQEVQGINADQGRLRENMKALKGSAEEKALLLRYTRALNREEDRLNVLGEEITQLKKKREMAGKSLDQLVMGVNLDQTF
jgi:archaellum component FlaC